MPLPSISSYPCEAHNIPEKLTLDSHELGTADSSTPCIESLVWAACLQVIWFSLIEGRNCCMENRPFYKKKKKRNKQKPNDNGIQADWTSTSMLAQWMITTKYTHKKITLYISSPTRQLQFISILQTFSHLPIKWRRFTRNSCLQRYRFCKSAPPWKAGIFGKATVWQMQVQNQVNPESQT